MCRFALYLGSQNIPISTLVTEPAHSLIHQSYQSRERSEPLNGDGFGVAWYAQEEPEPAIFKDISPAWSNANLRHLARVTRSRCILAHVRAATSGLPVTYTNCHPFAEQQLSFMHNGELSCFTRQRRKCLAMLSDNAYQVIKGTTDSEFLFALFLDNYWTLGNQTEPLQRLQQALSATIEQAATLCNQHRYGTSTLNLVVADGSRAVASRFTDGTPEEANSLYVQSGGSYCCNDGYCSMEQADEQQHRSVIITSEGLNDDPQWQRVPVNHLVTVSDTLDVQFKQIP
ncbi:MAG: class II glutamine amidotransferase [Porticoccaceae bacterium]|nr:class II glutamine amidotransferase [Porticoccaceae bacterium]